MAVRPITTSQTVSAAQTVSEIVGGAGATRPITPFGGAEEGAQPIERIIGGT